MYAKISSTKYGYGIFHHYQSIFENVNKSSFYKNSFEDVSITIL